MTSLPYIDKILCAQVVVVYIWWYTDPPDLRQFCLSLYKNNLKGKLGLFSNRSFLRASSFTFVLPSTPATQLFAIKSYQQGTFSLYFNPAGSWLGSLCITLRSWDMRQPDRVGFDQVDSDLRSTRYPGYSWDNKIDKDYTGISWDTRGSWDSPREPKSIQV